MKKVNLDLEYEKWKKKHPKGTEKQWQIYQSENDLWDKTNPIKEGDV